MLLTSIEIRDAVLMALSSLRANKFRSFLTILGVMIGVGAVFDFYSGEKKQAPRWIQKIGLEWLFRLSNDPGRLWKRYLKHNPRFVWHFFKQWLSYKYSWQK